MNLFDKYYQDTPDYFGSYPPIHFKEAYTRYVPFAGKALDLGCGQGRFSKFLADKGFEVTSVDLSAIGIQQLDSFARTAKKAIVAIHDNVLNFPILAGRYELIVAATILDHLSVRDARTLAGKIYGGLAPYGVAYIECHTEGDAGCRAGRGEKCLAVSECRSQIRHFFCKGQLLRWFEKGRTLSYEEAEFMDDAHGPVHSHEFARLWTQKV